MRRIYGLIAFALMSGLMLLLSLSVPVQPVQAQQNFGTNWGANFFNTADLTGPAVATITYPNGINFNWGTGSPTDAANQPLAGVNQDNWSARFTTTENITPGSYEFIVVADDGARLTINGTPIFDNFGDTGQATYTATVEIVAGQTQISVEYVDRTGQAILQISWAPAGIAQPTNTPVPAAQGEVQVVTGLAVRTGPYLGASLVAVARPNNRYDIISRNDGEGLFTWYKIQFNENTVGWSSGRYLAVVQGDVNTIPFEDSVFDTLQDNLPPSRGIMGATRAIMNFRVRPSERVPRNAVIPQISWGDPIEILGRTVQGGQSFWLFVAYNPPDEDTTPTQYGWIFAPFITIRGPIDAVPVY
jgi:hypothetical protein